MIVAFDCDGTLIRYDNTPNEEIVNLAKVLSNAEGVDVMVWSGGGRAYAESVAMRVGLDLERVQCFAKFTRGLPDIDIAIDDDNMVSGVKKLLLVKAGRLASENVAAE